MPATDLFSSDPGPTFDELMDDLEDRHLDVLINFFNQTSFQDGETIFEQDDPADNFYIIRSGEVHILKSPDPDSEKEPIPLVTLTDGNLLGEMSFVTDANRSSSAVATRDTEAYEVKRGGFDKLLRNHPTVAFKIYDAIIRVLAYRLQRTDEKLVNLADRAEVDLLTGQEQG